MDDLVEHYDGDYFKLQVSVSALREEAGCLVQCDISAYLDVLYPYISTSKHACVMCAQCAARCFTRFRNGSDTMAPNIDCLYKHV